MTVDPGSLGRLITRLEALVVRARALRWALDRSSRSGRSAHRFARDGVGRKTLGET